MCQEAIFRRPFRALSLAMNSTAIDSTRLLSRQLEHRTTTNRQPIRIMVECFEPRRQVRGTCFVRKRPA